MLTPAMARWSARLLPLASAWILWQRAEFGAGEGAGAAPPQRLSSAYGTYATVAECENAKVKLFQDTVKQYQPSDLNKGVDSLNTMSNEMLMITFKGRGGNVALQFRCLPDNVDLRGAPKGQ